MTDQPLRWLSEKLHNTVCILAWIVRCDGKMLENNSYGLLKRTESIFHSTQKANKIPKSHSSTSKHKTHCALGLYCCIAQTQIPNKFRVALYNNAIAYSENWMANCCAGPLWCSNGLDWRQSGAAKKAIAKQLSLAAFDQ